MRSNYLWVLSAVAQVVAAGSSNDCPDQFTSMAMLNYSLPATAFHGSSGGGSNTVLLLACEDLRTPSGAITFVLPTAATPATPATSAAAMAAAAALFPLTLRKRVASNQPVGGDDDAYLNYTKAEVLAAPTDVLGEALLGGSGDDPSLAAVAAAVPPLRSFNGARVWVANRDSMRDASFDGSGANGGAGTPSPAQANALLPGYGGGGFTAEGTIGEALPLLLLNFPTDKSMSTGGANGSFYEMAVVPVPNGTGLEQPVFVRFLSVNASAAAAATATASATATACA